MKAWPPALEFPGIVGSVLAHQGGWDEMLMIVGPLAVVGGALWMANKRANQLEQAESAASGTERDD
ncbi:MAG: hypothetical protein AAGD35_06085 [Actinomycetota bacterium]